MLTRDTYATPAAPLQVHTHAPSHYKRPAPGLFLAISLFLVALTACTQSAASQPEGSQAPAASRSPAASGSPAPAASPATAPANQDAGGQLALPPGSLVRFTLAPNANKAGYRAQEQLRGLNFPSEAVGSTREVGGSVTIDQNGAIRPADSLITVDLRNLRSDESIRDNYIQQNTLETAQYPTAEFRPTEVRGLPSPLPTGRDVNLEILGDLTVYDTTQPVTWTGTARLDGDTLTGNLTTRVTITQFGMALPSVFRVLSLEDALTLEVTLQATSEILPPQ